MTLVDSNFNFLFGRPHGETQGNLPVSKIFFLLHRLGITHRVRSQNVWNNKKKYQLADVRKVLDSFTLCPLVSSFDQTPYPLWRSFMDDPHSCLIRSARPVGRISTMGITLSQDFLYDSEQLMDRY